MAVKVSVAGSGTTTASLSTVNPNVKISTIGIQGPAGTGIDLTTAGTATASKALVLDSDSKIDVLKSGDLVITGSSNTIGHADDTDLLTIASGTFTVAGTTITTANYWWNRCYIYSIRIKHTRWCYFNCHRVKYIRR